MLGLFYFEERCDFELIGIEIFCHEILNRLFDVVLILEEMSDQINMPNIFFQQLSGSFDVFLLQP